MTPEPSLYEKYGGDPTVLAVVKSFYRRAMANPLLSRYFHGVDMPALLNHQAQFVAFMMGKQDEVFEDINLHRAHQHLRITETAFQEMLRVLRETLDAAGVEPADARVLCERLEGRRDVIVAR